VDRIFFSSNKSYFIARMLFWFLLVGISLSSVIGRVQAAPEVEYSSGHCSSSRQLLHRAILQRLDFALSDGRGNGYGLPERYMADENETFEIDIHRLDFALSDGRGNGHGLPEAFITSDNEYHTMNIHRLDFALSDGRGNGLGLRDGSILLTSNVLAMVCP